MISFDNFTMDDGSPIYMQITLHIKRGIIAGIVRNEDEMPSRRVLSVLLGVNPNTVQKAYSLLEEEGIVKSRSGAKSFIVLDRNTQKHLRDELLETDIKSVIQAMQQMGISKSEALSLIDKYWKQGKESSYL